MSVVFNYICLYACIESMFAFIATTDPPKADKNTASILKNLLKISKKRDNRIAR